MIDVKKLSDNEYQVTVDENGSTTTHTVTVDNAYHQHLTGSSITKEELIEKSFEFLLAREPKESILRTFNIKEINRYYPDYEGQWRK
jgi:hypothetical protein